MDSLMRHHRTWLNSYRRSKLFGCPAGGKEASCEVYHVLSPVLHDIGFLTSYRAYESLIPKIVCDVFYDVPCPAILVVGIESEASARALVQALEIFRDRYTLTFIDCCPTPLNRINRCIQAHETEYLSTQLLDIFDPSAQSLYAQFDIVFVDSFLKQFSEEQKTGAIKAVANFVKPGNGIIIFREYFGNLNEILQLSWQKLETLLKQPGLSLFSSEKEAGKFRKMVGHLDRYYKNSGLFYSSAEAFRYDLELCGLKVVSEFMNKAAFDSVFVATK